MSDSYDSTSARIAAQVQSALEAMDDTPRRTNWRHRAIGMTKAQALAGADRDKRIEIIVPLTEWRIIKMTCGKERTATYARRALFERLVRDGVDPKTLPSLNRE